MTRKIKTTTVEEKELPIDQVADDSSMTTGLINPLQPTQWIETPTEEESNLQQFFEGLGEGEIVIKIYKFDATTNRPRFMADTGLDGASEAFVQANWGEGRYMMKAYKEGKALGSRTILVGPALQKNIPASVTPLPPLPLGMDPTMQLQLEMVRQEMQTNREFMKLMVDNMNKGDGKSGAMELAEVMVMLKGVIPPASTAPSILEIMSQTIPLVKQLIELGANGGAPAEKGWVGTIKEILPEVGGVLRNIIGARLGASAVNSPDPGVAVPSYPNQIRQAAPNGSEIPGLTKEQLVLLRQGISFLKTRARRNADADAFVGYVLETLDDEQSLAICSLLERSFEDIAVIDPEILQPVYRPWFEDFFGGLKDAIIERNTASGAGGDANEPKQDAGSGVGGDKVGS
jgi:hypothetical protein